MVSSTRFFNISRLILNFKLIQIFLKNLITNLQSYFWNIDPQTFCIILKYTHSRQLLTIHYYQRDTQILDLHKKIWRQKFN